VFTLAGFRRDQVEEAKLAAARAEAEKKRMEEDAGRLAAMQQEVG